MCAEEDHEFAPIDEHEDAAGGGSAVLLRGYTELPHVKLSSSLGMFSGTVKVDIASRLHHQQGIVWECLPADAAQTLATLLTDSGYPCSVVPQSQVVKLGRFSFCRRAAPIEERIELYDEYERARMIRADEFILAHAGWISETIETDRSAAKISQGFGSRDPIAGMFNQAMKESGDMGWVLHLFSSVEPKWIRIEGRHFNYTYQNLSDETWQNHFKIMLQDFAKVIPEKCLDEGYKLSMHDPANPPKGAGYRSLREMIERARWMLTMKSLPEESTEQGEDEMKLRKV